MGVKLGHHSFVYPFPNDICLVILGALHDSFPGVSCWGDFILGQFHNHFCESGSLLNTNIPASLWIVELILVQMIPIRSMLRLLVSSML